MALTSKARPPDVLPADDLRQTHHFRLHMFVDVESRMFVTVCVLTVVVIMVSTSRCRSSATLDVLVILISRSVLYFFRHINIIS